jgi:group II intron reverse transcriptase/maturase
MNEPGKSDKPVVPVKSAKIGYWDFYQQYIERMKGRGLAKDNGEGQAPAPAGPAKQVDGTQRPVAKSEDLHSALDRIRQAACRDKQVKFTSIWHHVYNIDRLRQAYLALKRDAVAGVDEQTWKTYGQELESNLRNLSDRLTAGTYRAKPVKRVYIPKADGKQRPIGIPALEDKIVQRATVVVLNAVYETDFLGFSYGYRPGRSAHMALDALAVAIQSRKVSWLLDADIKSFFDTLSHERLVKLIGQRIADPRVVRHIQKWLNAGVMEEGKCIEQIEGVPQGGSVSPLLANVYLHYAFDLWAEQWRKTQARGDVIIVRYADDFVVGFQHESDAVRFLDELRERFRQYNLELHAEKTRVIEFGRFASERRSNRGQGKPETFNFLGFTHICDKRRKDGKFIVLRQTMAKRMRAKLKSLKETLRRRMHHCLHEVGRWLTQVVDGHYRYYGVPRNYPAMNQFRDRLRRLWWRALTLRGQKGRIGNKRMARISKRWLPRPRIIHPYPEMRLAVMIRGKSPVR